MPIIPGLCSACGSGGSSGGEFEHNSVVLCDTLADGTVVAAIILVQEYDEVTGLPVGAPVPTDPETGLPYVVQGTLQACSSEAPLALGDVCYSQLGPFTTLIPNDATSVPPATGLGNPGQQYVATVANWGGSGVALSIATFGDAPGDVGDAVNTAGAAIPGHIDLGATFVGVTVDFEFFDAQNNERLTGINQPFTLGAGTDGTIGDGGTSYTPGPISYGSGTANLIFAGPVRTIDFTFLADAVAGFPASIAVQQVTATAVIKAAFAVQCDSCIGPITYRDAVTGATVAAANLTNCPTQTDISAPVISPVVFAGFVCDVFGGTPLVPRVFPSCPGAGLTPVVSNTPAFFVDGVTEGPAGTFTATGPNLPLWQYSKVPFNDENQAFCSVEFTLDGSTGADASGWQLIGNGADFLTNGVNLDAVWISAIEAILGVGDASDIPLPFTATALTGDGHSVTITVTGPTTHFQMFAGNGAFAFRETDNDGLSATVRLDFATPMSVFTVAANVVLPSVGSMSGFQQALATPGTSAVPAQPAGIFEVKQFRNNDGTAFYENLDGSVHTVLGTIGECGEYSQEILCDATGVSFLRVYKIAGGTVASFQDYDLAGAVFAANAPVGICSETLATFRHTPIEVLCWTETSTGIVTEFLRRYLVTQDGISVVAVIDTLLDGTTAFLASNAGTVAECGGSDACETASSLGTICYTPPPVSIPGVARTTTFAGATQVGVSPGARTYTVPNWGGGTVPLVFSVASSTGGFPNVNGAQIGVTAVTPNHCQVNLGEPLVNVTFTIFAFDVATAEKLINISPPFTSVTGGTFTTVGFTEIDAVGPGITFVDVHFAGPVQTIDFDYTHTGVAGIGINNIAGSTATVTTSQTQGTAAVVQDCVSGVISYVDLATGLAVDISAVTIVDCGAASTTVVTRDEELMVLCSTTAGVTTQFMRKYNYDGQTGAIIGFVDTTLDGTTPFVPGTVGLCATAAIPVVTRDEELLVLCDTAPTTPAATVTGNWVGATNTGAGNAPGVWTKTNWGGSGITVTAAQDFLHGSSSAGNIDMGRTPAAAGQVVTTIDLGAVRQNIFVNLNYFGTTAAEQITNLVPAADAVTGAATLGGGGTTVTPTAPDGNGILIHIPGPTQTVTLTWNSAGGLSGIGNIIFDTFAVPGATSRFLRKYNYDGQTGAFIGTVDTALDGTTAHVIAGTVSQCSDATAVTPVTANAQSILLTAGQTWTPGGSVTGTLTGVAFATVTGTTTVTDSNGTVAAGLPPGLSGNWQVGDADALVGPQSIAAIGGNTWVTWTQK